MPPGVSVLTFFADACMQGIVNLVDGAGRGILRVASCELRVASASCECELRVESCEFELQVASCELICASCELKNASSNLRVDKCELRVSHISELKIGVYFSSLGF